MIFFFCQNVFACSNFFPVKNKNINVKAGISDEIRLEKNWLREKLPLGLFGN